jgi:ADP-ribose pyrophosphatase YjhB (NUDIX family)
MFTRRAIEPGLGKLDLPGGFVDSHENAEEALRRELKEELGIEDGSLEYFASAPNEYVFSEFSVFTLDLAFIVKPKTLDGIKAMDDISGFEFIAPKDVDFSELPAPSMQFFVGEYLRRNGKNQK